jgi:hypothetical protein
VGSVSRGSPPARPTTKQPTSDPNLGIRGKPNYISASLSNPGLRAPPDYARSQDQPPCQQLPHIHASQPPASPTTQQLTNQPAIPDAAAYLCLNSQTPTAQPTSDSLSASRPAATPSSSASRRGRAFQRAQAMALGSRTSVRPGGCIWPDCFGERGGSQPLRRGASRRVTRQAARWLSLPGVRPRAANSSAARNLAAGGRPEQQRSTARRPARAA